MFRRGDFVKLNGLLAVVVGTESDGDAPEDHVAIWYGNSEVTSGVQLPEVWIVPEKYCIPGPPPTLKH